MSRSPGRPHAARLRSAAQRLCRDVEALRFAAPVSYVYNPLRYAARGYAAYLDAYATGRRHVIFLGMNPGPFGMAQTGVPFGDVGMVRGFLGIQARIDRPDPEHPKRPVEGFDCGRSEVSGTRLWGAIAEHWGDPKHFFRRHFVANYCPLAFLEAGGRNRTPDRLPAAEREALFAACDRHLLRMVEVLEPEWVIGIGAFAEGRAHEALAQGGVKTARILHPSPASPLANRGWAPAVRRELAELGLCEAPLRSGKRR